MSHPSESAPMSASRHALLLFFALASASPHTGALSRITIDFDGDEVPLTSGDFAHAGAQWRGGRVATEGVPGLHASGAFYYAFGSDGGEVRFDPPVTALRFFYVHGFGYPAGTASAYDADGTLLAAVDSRQASFLAAPGNFASFDVESAVARVEFSGGVVDAVSWQALDAGGPPISTAVNGAWVISSHAPFIDGQGLLFEFVPEAGELFLAWFSYADDASGTQRWLSGNGPVDGHVATMQLVTTSGGVFNQPTAIQRLPAGTLTVTFSACDRGTVDLQRPGRAPERFEITRLRTLVTDFACE